MDQQTALALRSLVLYFLMKSSCIGCLSLSEMADKNMTCSQAGSCFCSSRRTYMLLWVAFPVPSAENTLLASAELAFRVHHAGLPANRFSCLTARNTQKSICSSKQEDSFCQQLCGRPQQKVHKFRRPIHLMELKLQISSSL